MKTQARQLLTLFVISSIGFLALPAVAATGDATVGQQASAACQGCHGPDGNSFAPMFPHLAGQNADYLSKQIQDFQSGARKDETMSGMVAGLSEKDIADIAAYFSTQKLQPQTGSGETELLTLGRKIYKGGNVYSGLPACAGCHGPTGAGNPSAVFPSLAGQQLDYLIKALNDFKTETRSNDPNEMMRNIAAKLTENEIKAVSAYIGSLNAPKKDDAQ